MVCCGILMKFVSIVTWQNARLMQAWHPRLMPPTHPPSLMSPQVVAVPYGTSFDHLRVADEVHFKFERCLKALGPQVDGWA